MTQKLPMDFDADIAKKYLKGKFSLKDKVLVDHYFENEIFSNQLDNVLNEFWEETSSSLPRDNRNFETLKTQNGQQAIPTFIPKTARIRKIWQVYSRIAAIFLLPFIFASVIYFVNGRSSASTWVEIHSPQGTRTQFSLPDGSTGWLNSGSIVRYPSHFTSERTVSLIGEAFFDVVKNPDSPFIVDAKPFKVKVLGTSFNVLSYKNDSLSEVVVVSGIVEVNADGISKSTQLKPSERLMLNRNTMSLVESKVDAKSYTAWKSGKLIFMNDDLIEVIRKLSRFYNVDVEVKPEVNKNELFRAMLEEESLEEVLRYMKLTMSIDYVIMERQQDKDNTISKRKVVIKKKDAYEETLKNK